MALGRTLQATLRCDVEGEPVSVWVDERLSGSVRLLHVSRVTIHSALPTRLPIIRFLRPLHQGQAIWGLYHSKALFTRNVLKKTVLNLNTLRKSPSPSRIVSLWRGPFLHNQLFQILQIMFIFIAARKRILGQRNIFTSVCHSVHGEGGFPACTTGHYINRGCTSSRGSPHGISLYSQRMI